MLLAIDIGNTAIKFGVFDGEVLVSRSSTPTKAAQTGRELSIHFKEELNFRVAAAVACSVVPQLDHAVKRCVEDRFGFAPYFIANDFNFGLTLRYETVETLGTDRLVNAYAAAAQYGTPVIVCSLGTATTIDVVSAQREYLGGVIAPGMSAMAEVLQVKTAKLPLIEIARPDDVIGKTTETSIRSGVFFGYTSLVDGLIRRISEQIASPTVVATGGLASSVAAETDAIDIVNENLLLEGLRLASETIHKPQNRD